MTVNREEQGFFGKASPTHCIDNEIIQEAVWGREADLITMKKKKKKRYVFLRTKSGYLKCEDTHLDGESELDEMKFRKERHFECV